MKQTKLIQKEIDGAAVDFLIEQKVDFNGITLEAVGDPEVICTVNGKRVDAVETFGDECIRKVIIEARL